MFSDLNLFLSQFLELFIWASFILCKDFQSGSYAHFLHAQVLTANMVIVDWNKRVNKLNIFMFPTHADIW